MKSLVGYFYGGDGCGMKTGKGAYQTKVIPKLASSIIMTPSKANPRQFKVDKQ